MTASILYSQTLSSLIAARSAMLTPEWQAYLTTLNTDDRTAAWQESLQIQLAISTLSEAALAKVAAQMVAEADDLSKATSDLATIAANLARVNEILHAATQVLAIVGKIVSIA